jgi:putative ABC transport system permease protein
MSLALKLASRNLFHDRLRFVATIVGIVFSIVLVTVQMGLYVSFDRMVTTMIEHTPADLWIVPAGTKCFEDPSLLDERERFRALSTNGVADVRPLVIGFAQWKTPAGGTTPVFIIGSDTKAQGLRPWDLIEGSFGALDIPSTVVVDQSYLERLGIGGLNASAEIGEQRVRVAGLTKGIRSFTTTPYVFTSLDRARTYTGTSPSKTSYLLVQVAPDADVTGVRRRLQQTMSGTEILTPAEFGSRSRSFWLFGTGAGAALFAGALLGVIVGTIIVAQTLYSSTKDHLNEFATLRAMGSSGLYIHKVIIFQALLSAIVGFAVAAAIGWSIAGATAETALPVVMTPLLLLSLFALTVIMCVLSALSAILQVIRIDPAMAFTR